MKTNKTTQFKDLLQSGKLEFTMEAHSGISAIIAEEAGFSSIWASGLSMSAMCGLRDSNEASWTQILEIVEFMADATNIPIIIDADTGFGNFNNARRLVRKLEQRHVAALCIEDKLFPKTNSFVNSKKQPLATIDEFTGKIKAIKDSQQDPDFCVIARTEALITGWGLSEALARAEAYHRAGADGILIHSKSECADEILAFAEQWADTCPIVIVPTTYHRTPTELFEQAGISIVIWANHLMRSSIAAMQKTASVIYQQHMVGGVEDEIATIAEVFRLQNIEELLAAEKQYLPSEASNHSAPTSVQHEENDDYLDINAAS